jgi:group I intron endonuclease
MNSLLKIAEIFPFSIISNDLAYPWQIGFQDSASPGLSGIIELHDTIFFYLVVIAIGVFWLLGSVIYSYSSEKSNIVHKYLNHGTIKCLSKLEELDLNATNFTENRSLTFSFNYSHRRPSYEREGIKIHHKKLKPIFCSKRDILKLFSIQIRQYSNETLIYPLTTEKKDKESEKTFSEIDRSLNYLNPVKSYEDTYTCKKEIYKDNKDKSGIYRFYNKINGNFYIGSSTNLKNRFVRYFNLSYISKVRNELSISRALIKYGYSNFRLDILEYCDNSKNILLEREQYYIDLLKPVYNIEKIAGSSAGRKLSDETKQLISNSLKNRYLTQPSKNKGKFHTEETKLLMSMSRTGSKNPFYGNKHREVSKELIRKSKIGKTQSIETREAISTTLGQTIYLYKKNTDKSPEVEFTDKISLLSKDNLINNSNIVTNNNSFTLIQKFQSMRKLGEYLGVSHSTISSYLKTGKVYKGIYKIIKYPLL